jgi:hypothetical protein
MIHSSLKRSTRKSGGWSRAGDKEANNILIIRRDELELLAKGSWRSRLPIACPFDQRSAGLFAPGGFWRTMHARPDACTRAILDSRLA